MKKAKLTNNKANLRIHIKTRMRDLGFDVICEVIESWEVLRRIPKYKEATGSLIYQRLFDSCPQIKILFGFPIDINVNSDTVWKSKIFLMHAKYITEMFERALGMLGPDIELLTIVLQDLGGRHAKYGVTADMYPMMGEALIFALEKQLGKRFTPRLKKSWSDVYSELIYDMMHHNKDMKEGSQVIFTGENATKPNLISKDNSTRNRKRI